MSYRRLQIISSPASKSKINYDRDLAIDGIDVWYPFDISGISVHVYAQITKRSSC
jgi:hypothetical protein